KIRTVERSILQTDERNKGTFQIMLDTTGFPTMDPITGWLVNFKTGASQNFVKYTNPDLDKMMDQLEIEQDAAKRKTLAGQIEDQLEKDSPWVTIGWTDHLPMWNSKVKGLNQEKRRFSQWN